MNANLAVALIGLLQYAFLMVGRLELTTYLYPRQAHVKDNATYDFIVVGTGTAGSVIATRIAQNKKIHVLAIEAGGDPPIESNIPSTLIFLEKSYADWQFTEENDGFTQKCSKSRKTVIQGKMLGGTSSLNYILYDQGSFHDYDKWSDIVNDKIWSFKNLEPYIKKSENLVDPVITNSSDSKNFGTGGPMTITKDRHSQIYDYLNSFKELGYKVVSALSANKPMGVAPQLYAIGNYMRQSTSNAYLSKAKNWDNLHVLKSALVTKIIFDDNKNAVAVEVNTENGKMIKINAKKEIIISAGAINSPKLLMLSGIGPKKHLKSLNIEVISNLPVGQNLQDHASVPLIFNMTKLRTSTVSLNPGVFPAYVFNGLVSDVKYSNCPDHRILSYVNFPGNFIYYCAFTYGYCNNICNELFANGGKNQILWNFISNSKPKSRGELLLSSAKYSDPPIIKPNYLSNKDDLNKLVEHVKQFMRINETEFLRRADANFMTPKLKPCKGLEFGSTKYWECYIKCMMTAQRNYCGTCAMGTVVDSRLRVKGVKKLRVADSSIMPEITSGGTAGPTIYIGERAAHIIKEYYQLNKKYERNLSSDDNI